MADFFDNELELSTPKKKDEFGFDIPQFGSGGQVTPRKKRSPLEEILSGDFGSLSLSSDKIEAPNQDKLFNREMIENSPLGKFSGKDRLGSDGKELGDSIKGFFKDMPKEKQRGLSSIFSTLTSSLSDRSKRNEQGNLAAVQAATSPFAKADLVKGFNQGVGGADLSTDIQEAILLDENRARRDKEQVIKDSLFGLKSDNAKLQNQILKDVRERALETKAKQMQVNKTKVK